MSIRWYGLVMLMIFIMVMVIHMKHIQKHCWLLVEKKLPKCINLYFHWESFNKSSTTPPTSLFATLYCITVYVYEIYPSKNVEPVLLNIVRPLEFH